MCSSRAASELLKLWQYLKPDSAQTQSLVVTNAGLNEGATVPDLPLPARRCLSLPNAIRLFSE